MNNHDQDQYLHYTLYITYQKILNSQLHFIFVGIFWIFKVETWDSFQNWNSWIEAFKNAANVENEVYYSLLYLSLYLLIDSRSLRVGGTIAFLAIFFQFSGIFWWKIDQYFLSRLSMAKRISILNRLIPKLSDSLSGWPMTSCPIT